MAVPLEFGLNISWIKPDCVVAFAKAAEDMNFESVWIGEHIGLAKRDDWWKVYPGVIAAGDEGNEDTPPFKIDSPFLDPLITLAHVSGATKKIRLGTGIYMLVLRDAILAGRSLAALDVLSNGRLDLAIGLGWSEEEYRFTNNDWKTRGPRTDEMIQCIKTLFTDEFPEFHGRFFDFPPIGFQPKPIQRPFPIHIGGFSPAAARRAGKYGDGWYGAPDLIPAVKAELKKNGRENVPFKWSSLFLAGPISQQELDAAAAQGVERVMVTPWPNKKVGDIGMEGLKALEEYAKELGLF